MLFRRRAHAGESEHEDTGVATHLEPIPSLHDPGSPAGLAGSRGRHFSLEPGEIAGLSGIPGSGLTRVGMALLAPYAQRGPLAYLDVRGWANPLMAWELGIDPEHFVVVRAGNVVVWARAVATLLGGVSAVYAEVPGGVGDAAIRTLAAKARVRRTPLVLRSIDGELPRGILHLYLEGRDVLWEGTEDGHGMLLHRRCLFEVSGKAMRGVEGTIEVEDDGTNDLRVVPHLGARAIRRLA